MATTVIGGFRVAVSDLEFKRKLQRFMQLKNKTLPDTIRDAGRLLAVALGNATAPFSGGADKNSAQVSGINAIKADLFGGRQAGSSKGIGVLRMIMGSTPQSGRGDETMRVNLGWEQSKSVAIYKQFWRPDAGLNELNNFVKPKRSNRTGRVSQMTSSEIGRWKVVDQIWVSTDKALDYLEHRQQRVGYAKSAWAECARILGGMRGMPTWVSRQKNKRGTVTDDTKRRSFPVVTLHALPDYMSRVLSESRKRDAINLQRKNFRKHIETTIKKAAREASATR